jgi:hypothetical protein
MNKEGILLSDLKKMLIENNVIFKPLDNYEVYTNLFVNNNDKYIGEFKKLIKTFLGLFKSNGYTSKNFNDLRELILKNDSAFLKQRALVFMDIMEPLFDYYTNYLEINRKIDFNDMINMATDIVKGKSELCKRLDPIVTAWNERNLRDSRFPFLVVDALVLKVREEGRVRSRGVMLAYGVNDDGYREILGLMLGDSESEASWSEFFSWLKSRDLRGVDVIVSDHHGGLVKAIRQHFQGVTWQRCQTHFMRNILDVTPKSLQEKLYPHVRAILDAPDMDTARLLLNQTLQAYETRAQIC